MTSQKELKLAYGLAVILLFVGVICYAAAPVETPDEPIRIMYKTVAGKVLFDHKTHTGASGYGLACIDCHHHPEDPEDDEAALRSCGDCHQLSVEDETLPESCTECHEPDEIEGSEVSKRSDAFHYQCESCHQEGGAGPEENRCSWCHIS